MPTVIRKVLISVLVIVVLASCIGHIPRLVWSSYSENIESKHGREVFTSTPLMTRRSHNRGSQSRGHTSGSKLPKLLPSMLDLTNSFKKGRYPLTPLKDYNLSDGEVAMVAQLFNIRGLDSNLSLQRDFLNCPAKHFVLDSRVHKFVHGRFVLTKEYQTCKDLSFKEQRGTVGLISFPGSGNSWVRQLLETSTGVFTGSTYCDRSYVEDGMVGEGIDSKFVVAVKCHNCRRRTMERFSKVIYVVRNPFDAILAEFTRKTVRRVSNVNASARHTAELGSTGISKQHVLIISTDVLTIPLCVMWEPLGGL